MRKYSIAAFVTLSMGCVGACGGESLTDGTGSVNTAGTTGTNAGTSGTMGGTASTSGGTASTSGGTASTSGGKATGGVTGTAGTANVTGGTAGTNSGGTATAGTGGNAAGGMAGANAGGDDAVCGENAAGGMGGSADTGGSATGGSISTGGMAGTGTGGTSSGGSGGSSPGPTCDEADEGVQLSLTCAGSSVITAITYASYGTPTGSCGSYVTGTCDSVTSVSEVEAACVGQNSCTVDATNGVFGDPCVGTYKRLYVEATCGNCGNGAVDSGEACDDGLNDGVLCSADCSAEPEVAQILLHCDPFSEVINQLAGTDCIVVNPGGASFVTFSSPDVEVTLYSNADCTGNTKIVSTPINFCQDSFDQGGGLNDQVQSVKVSRK